MPSTIRYDSLLVRQLARELNAELAGSELVALQFERDRQRVVLTFGERALVWEVRSGAIAWEAGGPAGSGLPLLRRPVIASVDALRDERILSIGFRGGKRQNAAHGLLVELLPNASNAIALDERGRVLKSLFPRSGSRAQTRGQPYLPPEPLEREGAERPLDFNDWDHLLTSVPAPEIAERLIARVAYVSGINVHALLPGAEQSIAQSHERYLELILGAARPAILPSQQPYCHPLWEANAVDFPTLLAAISTAAARSQVTASAVDRLEQSLNREQKKLEKLQRELDSAAADAERLRAHADLLLASAADVKRGAESAELTGFDGAKVNLTLDPSRSAVENAQDWYAEARKRERAGERLPALIRDTKHAVAQVEEKLTRARAGELADASAEPPKPAAKPAQRGPRLPYKQYRTSGGLEVRVGRSSRDNDELTLRHAAPNDIWMHARAVGGAHVVLRWSDGAAHPPRQDMVEAATLAAVNSRARHAGTVPVDWTRKKHVRKHRGAPAGQVMLERAKTIFVQPNAALEEKLRWQE